MKLSQKIITNTRKKALKLIYDPICLFKLLYSKYGDIEEDYDLLIINQLVYDTSTRLNILFKEYQFYENYEEFLKRWYKFQESSNRIPKLSEYYKNYHKFFCRPNFNDFIISNLMHNCTDDKAELFYKKNFEFTKSEDISDKNNSSALSSIDNITNNKTIFTSKNKFIIEGNEKSINYSLTLTLNNTTIKSIENNKKNLISARSIKNSFEEIVHNLVYYQKKKQIKKNKKVKKEKEKENTNKNKKEISSKSLKSKMSRKIINNIDKNKIKTSNNNMHNKEKKNTNQFAILSKPNIISHTNYNKKNSLNNLNILNTVLKAFNSPKNGNKGSKNQNKTKFEEYNHNINNIKNNNNNIRHQRIKTYNFSQNYSLSNHSGENKTHNLISLINIKNLPKKTNHNKVKSNNIMTLKDLTKKQNSRKKINKNKTFDNNFYTQINQMNSMPLLKYKLSSSNKKLNNQYKSNKNIIKNNNFIGSKFNLVKNFKSSNNIEKNKNRKHSSYNYYQNILTQILPDENMKQNKNIISFGTNINNSNSSQKNKSISPINTKTNIKLSNNINDIKYKNKLAKNQINNFNINFNNVFFTSTKPTSYIIENNNKNINNSHAYSSINVNKNLINNSLNNNMNGNNIINSNNILEQENKPGKNLYVMNLKNIYNFSRNKNNILINNNPMAQTEINQNKNQNNYNIIHIHKNSFNNINRNKDAKNILERNIHGNPNYLFGKHDINFNYKNQVQIRNKKNKQENQRVTNEIINFINKAQSKYIMRNKNRNNLEMPKTNKEVNTAGDELNKNVFKSNNKSFNYSKNIHSSSVSRRKNKSKIDLNKCNNGQNKYDKKVCNFTSQKNIKSKYKRKIQYK